MRDRKSSKPSDGWLTATIVVFSLAAILMPRLGSVWANALLWACLAIAWTVFVALADHFMGRRHRRQLAQAGAPRPPRAWRVAACGGLFMGLPQLALRGDLKSTAIVALAAILAVLVLAKVLPSVSERRDAERRKREVDELARRF